MNDLWDSDTSSLHMVTLHTGPLCLMPMQVLSGPCSMYNDIILTCFCAPDASVWRRWLWLWHTLLCKDLEKRLLWNSKENGTVLSRFQQIKLQETFWFQFLPPVLKVISVFPEMLRVWGYTAKISIWTSDFWLPDVTLSWLNKPHKRITFYGWDDCYLFPRLEWHRDSTDHVIVLYTFMIHKVIMWVCVSLSFWRLRLG